MKKTFELDFRGRKLIVENGELAKQAHGAVLVRYGDTVVLSTALVSNNANLLSDSKRKELIELSAPFSTPSSFINSGVNFGNKDNDEYLGSN